MSSNSYSFFDSSTMLTATLIMLPGLPNTRPGLFSKSSSVTASYMCVFHCAYKKANLR